MVFIILIIISSYVKELLTILEDDNSLYLLLLLVMFYFIWSKSFSHKKSVLEDLTFLQTSAVNLISAATLKAVKLCHIMIFALVNQYFSRLKLPSELRVVLWGEDTVLPTISWPRHVQTSLAPNKAHLNPVQLIWPVIAQIDYQSVTSFTNKLHEWLWLGKNRIQQNQLVSFSSFLISYFQAVLTINWAGGKIGKEKKRRKWPVPLILTERIGGDYLDWFAGRHAQTFFILPTFLYFVVLTTIIKIVQYKIHFY